MARNVVLITYDSLRADHCGFMGYDRDTTPFLDEMADDGVVFERAHASGVPTIASMSSVMTGEHSLASPEIGFNEAQREQVTERRTIAEVLSEAGYATGALSPNPPASSYFGFDDGFDWFEDFLAEEQGVFERAWNRVFQRSIEGGGLSTYLRLLRNVVMREEVLRPWEEYYDHLVEWRESVEEPYFLWVLLLEPHHPWLPPTEYQRWSSRWDKYRSFHHYWQMLNSGWEPGFDREVHDRLVNLYDDSIRYGDAFLDRLSRDLADDDPVYFVHADHGEEFGEAGRYGHQPYLTDPLTHVPLVISGLDDSRRVRTPVELRDIAPTVAEVAGVENRFPGRSLLSDDGRDPWSISKVFADDDRRLVVRTSGARYETGDETTTLTDASGAEVADEEVGDRMASLANRHVATEHDVRGIRAGAEELTGEGDG